MLLVEQVIKAAKSDSRLANNNMPPYIQKLRCRVNYNALRFAPHIESLGQVSDFLPVLHGIDEMWYYR